MCLILIARGAHPEFPLVVAGNRDEHYRRPTAAAAFWQDYPHVLAGRDLECLGTWLGVTRDGRFAALTNFRNPRARKTDAPSRGNLVSSYLESKVEPRAYIEKIAPSAARYNGFNLLLGDANALLCYSSHTGAVQELRSGIYGLSNHLLDTPWPKVARGKQRLRDLMARAPNAEALLDMLYDSEPAREEELPDTGVGPGVERTLSPALIVSDLYGTRASTAVLFGRNGEVSFTERTILPGGRIGATVHLSFSLDRSAVRAA